MKLIAGLFFCLLAISGALAADSCHADIQQQCTQHSSISLPNCNAVYGSYGTHGNVANELQAFTNLYLQRSYDYLLTAAHFNNYQKNRAGFKKLFQKLSDDTWEKTIELIKHITMRGGFMDFSRRSSMATSNYTADLHELESLGKALDTQKEIAERAFYIHREATRNSEHLHDPEIAQYMEEDFIDGHAKIIRELAGHTSDIKKIVSNNDKDLSLGLYIFDEYLQKKY